MTAHELAKVWRSRVGDATNDGDFDLTNMLEDGDARNCTHSTKAITGVTTKFDDDQARAARFLVRFDQRLGDGITLKYRGVAIHNPGTNQVNKIVGFKRIVVDQLLAGTGKEAAARKEEIAATLLGQEEGTWVGTQP